MATPADFSPSGVYGKQEKEEHESTGNPLWDAALNGIRDFLDEGPPPVLLTEIARRLSDDPFAETPEDQPTIFRAAKGIALAAARVGFTVVSRAVSFVFNMAKRFIFTIGRFIVRAIITPILSGLAAILTSPIGLVVLGAVSIGALSYFLYRTFFKGEAPETAAPVEGGETKEQGLTDVVAGLWDRGTKEFMDWATLTLSSDANTMAARGKGRTGEPGVGGTPGRPGGTEGRKITPAGSASAEKFKWAYREEFRKLGFTDPQISGMLGSIQQESNFDVNAYNPAGGGLGANGVMQWRGKRWKAYLEFRAQNPGLDEATAQAKFAAHEAVTDPYEKSMYAKIKMTNTPAQAAAAHGTYVERAGAHEVHNERRSRYGEAIHQQFLKQLGAQAATEGQGKDVGDTKPITSTQAATQSAGSSSTASQGNAPPAPLKEETQFLKTKHGPLPVGA